MTQHETSAPADRRRTTPKTTKSRRRTRQPSVSNMNSNGSERRRTLEAPELLRSRDPPPGSILAALRRTESSLTHGAATPVHCRGMTPPAVGPAYCQLAVVIFPLAHVPQHPKRRLSWLKKTNLKRRTDERQNTQREKHATAQRQRSDSAHTYTHPTQLTLLEHRLQPTPPKPGRTALL